MEGLKAFFTHIPADSIILVVVAAAAAIDGFRSGIGRAVTAALALPPALLLFTLLPKTAFVGAHIPQEGYMAVGIFVALFILVYLALRRMGLEFVGLGAGGPIPAIIGAISLTITAVLILEFVPVFQTYIGLSSYLQAMFAEEYRLFWLFGTYVLLAIAGR